MHIENSFQYLNAFESKRRLVEVLNVARLKYSPSEFDVFAPQIKRKLLEIDLAIQKYQQDVIHSHISLVSNLWAASAYVSYQVQGNTFAVGPSSVRWFSPAIASTLIGFPGGEKSLQTSFEF